MIKSILRTLRGKAVPVLLSAALLLTGVMSINLIKSLQGDARVINYTGIVRGAAQRLVKKELNHLPDDILIARLDGILSGLSDGSNELDLIRLPNAAFQDLLAKMKKEWAEIKVEIVRYRQGGSGEALLRLSEDYFVLADRTVLAAELFTEESVQDAKNALLYMNLAFIFLAGLSALSAFYHEQRRKRLEEAEEANRQKSERLLRLSQELLVPMNEISEVMYVSDIDTYALLFLNDVGKKAFHLDEKSDMKCYEALQGRDAPCPFCNIPLMKANETYTWEFTNPLTKRHYLLKDRLMEWEGRMARMEIAFDITETANEKMEMRDRLERDRILVECLRELHRNHNMEQATGYVLEQVGKLFSAGRAYVFQFHGESLSNTSEWCAQGVEPQIHNLQNLPQSEFAVWLDMFHKQENLIIDEVEKLKGTMIQGYELLVAQGIERAVLVPLEREGKVDGFIGLDNPLREHLENAASFLQTLRYFLMLAIRRSEDEELLSKLSYHDVLTSFYNRNRYIQDVDGLTGQSVPVGVIYVDVNGLKEVNDHFGHAAGDRVLTRCAQTIRRICKKGSFYRIGGDEFVIIYTGIGKTNFYEIVRELRSNFQGETCRAAIGTQWAEDCADLPAVITEADEIMYADKKAFYRNHQPSGRYRHHTDTARHLTDPELLREKMADSRFLLYLQPKVDAETRQAVGAEALVRYRDDDGQIVPPDAFIPILEDSRLISRVDFHVFETVCAKIWEWIVRGKSPFPVSCNFSRSSFMESSFVERLEALCGKYELPKAYLEIEVTESLNNVDYKKLKAQIDRVRAAGFQVSIDDFGIESSNLALLSMASFDALKIDKGFVKDIMINGNARTVVEAMVGMCRKMGIRLIAEGVEDEKQLAVLKECDVRIVQGFLFCPPIPVEEYEERYVVDCPVPECPPPPKGCA